MVSDDEKKFEEWIRHYFPENSEGRKFITELYLHNLSDESIKLYMVYYMAWVKGGYELTQEGVNEYISQHSENGRFFIRKYIEFKDAKGIRIIKPTGKKDKRVFEILSPEEYKRLSNYLYNNNPRDAILADLCYYGALRRSEAMALRPSSFDFKSEVGLIKVKAKGREREIVIPSNVMDELAGYLSQLQDTENILDSDKRIFRMSKTRWHDIIKNAGKKVLGKNISSHTFRRSRATEWLREGNFDLITIKDLLGHADISTTTKYAISDKKKSLDKLREYLKKS